jgi:DNA-binding protein HU-beta
MKKAELVANMAEVADISKAADRALTGCLETIKGSLQKGENVTLVGFDTFPTSDRAARTVAKFKVGKKLAEAVK